VDSPRLFVSARADRELGLFVRDSVARDQILFTLHRGLNAKPDVRSLPMDHGISPHSPSDMHCLIHHACLASAYIDWSGLCLRILRAVTPGDEVTLNFLTIYDEVPHPIVCRCGFSECFGEIRGFRYLTLDEKLKLELYLSPQLKALLQQQVRAARNQAS
jgi:hypothetical protein